MVSVGAVVGDFRFSCCLDVEREQLACSGVWTDFLTGGVSGMANSKPTLGFSGVTTEVVVTAGVVATARVVVTAGVVVTTGVVMTAGASGVAGSGTHGTTVVARTDD